MATENALVTVNSVIRAQERNTPQKQPGTQGWHAALPWSTPVTPFLKDNVILIYNSSKDAFTWFWIPYKWNHTTVHFSCLVALAHSAGSDSLLYAPCHGRTPRQGPIQPCRRAQVPVRDTLSTSGHSHVSICEGRQWPSASLTCTSLITMKISTCLHGRHHCGVPVQIFCVFSTWFFLQTYRKSLPVLDTSSLSGIPITMIFRALLDDTPTPSGQTQVFIRDASSWAAWMQCHLSAAFPDQPPPLHPCYFHCCFLYGLYHFVTICNYCLFS